MILQHSPCFLIFVTLSEIKLAELIFFEILYIIGDTVAKNNPFGEVLLFWFITYYNQNWNCALLRLSYRREAFVRQPNLKFG